MLILLDQICNKLLFHWIYMYTNIYLYKNQEPTLSMLGTSSCSFLILSLIRVRRTCKFADEYWTKHKIISLSIDPQVEFEMIGGKPTTHNYVLSPRCSAGGWRSLSWRGSCKGLRPGTADRTCRPRRPTPMRSAGGWAGGPAQNPGASAPLHSDPEESDSVRTNHLNLLRKTIDWERERKLIDMPGDLKGWGPSGFDPTSYCYCRRAAENPPKRCWENPLDYKSCSHRRHRLCCDRVLSSQSKSLKS